VEFQLLGPFTIVDATGPLELGVARRRQLLATLAIARAPLSEAELLSVVTDDEPSRATRRLLDVHLRSAQELLGPERLRIEPGSVRLDIREGELDADAFEIELDAGLAALADNDPVTAQALLEGALALWRGGVVEGLIPPALVRAEIARLEARRADAQRALADASTRARPAAPPAPASALPSGLVTFLLTDIVGSTARWERAPREMAEALERHDAVLADAVERAGGVFLKHRGEGDSTFSVFARPADAVAAAITAVRALAAEPWPPNADINVRVALHTGEAIERGRDYYGPTVNRTARLRGVAGAGQIVLSQATAALVRDSLAGDVSLVELGPHLLRDLTVAEHIHLVVDATMPAIEPMIDEAVDTVESWRRLPPRLRQRGSPFAGRTREQAACHDALTRARDGNGAVIVLGGEAGIGKTRLCVETASIAHDLGFVVAYGRCEESAAVPYQPFVAALGDLVEQLPLDVLSSYAHSFGGELARLTPALARRLPSVARPQAAAADTERHLLLDAVRGLVRHVSTMAPLLLVVDDLHWADVPTVALVHSVAELVADLPVVLMLTRRDREVGVADSIHDLLRTLHETGMATFLRVEGLAPDDVAGLVASIAGDDSDELRRFAERLCDETDGNPFFLVEVVRHLVETGGLAEVVASGADLEQLDIPDTLVGVITRRVARLGEPSDGLLRTAALIGREFDLGVLATVAGIDEEGALEALERAEAAHLVVESGTPGSFGFTHALIRQSLEQSVSVTRRTRTHVRIADAITSLYGDRPGPHTMALAAQLVAAGAAADRARVAAAATRAGDLALAQLAPHEAAEWYEVALRHADDDLPARCDALIGLGTAQQQTGIPAFRQTLLDAAALARTLGDDERLMAAALANNRGDRAVTYAIDHERVGVLEAALATGAGRDSPQLARVLALLALETAHDPDWALRLQRSDDALAMARRLRDAATLADVLRLRYEAIRLPETLSTRLTETVELRALAHQLGDPLQLGYAYCWRSRAALESGDVEELDRCWAIAWEYGTKARNPFLRWNLSAHRVFRAVMRGQLEQAERMAEECLEVANAAGEPDGRTVLGDQMLMIRDAQGRVAEVEPRIRRGVERYPHVGGMRGALAFVLSETGEFDEASAVLDADAADAFGGYTRDMTWMASLALAGRAAGTVRHPAAAGLLVDLLAPWVDQVFWSGATTHGPVAGVVARLRHVLGDADGALRDVDTALAMSRRMDVPLWTARALITGAEVRLARDAPDDRRWASAALREAGELAQQYGFASVQRDAEVLETVGAFDA
jgi:class 3 adenylate cyclase/tetratricopeptide (TPR) repeat protein